MYTKTDRREIRGGGVMLNVRERRNAAMRKAIVARYQAMARGEQDETVFLDDMVKLNKAYESLLGAEMCFEKTTAEIAKGETE